MEGIKEVGSSNPFEIANIIVGEVIYPESVSKAAKRYHVSKSEV